MPTKEILEELFGAVAENLRTAIIDFNQLFENETNTLIRLAEELNLDITDNINIDRGSIVSNTERVVLLPVAKACVIALLRHLLELAHNANRPIHIEKDRFRNNVVGYALDTKQFKRAIGLNNEQAENAIRLTAEVLLQEKRFESPVKLSLSGNIFEIIRHQDGDGFIVNHLAADKKSIAEILVSHRMAALRSE